MGSTNMTRMVGTEHAHDPVATTAPWDLVSAAGTAAAGLAPKIEGLGRYVVLRAIGQGGMGVVLAAYDPTLDRKVAIKLLREGLHAGSEGAVRMQREAQAMARLSHPNVAQVYEVGEAQGRLYLVMELVEGTTLREWLAARPRARHEVLRCFMEAGRGLAAAHAAGLIHRDFKPKPSRPPPKASPSAKCRGSPTTGAFERVAVCPGVVRSGQDGPKLAQS